MARNLILLFLLPVLHVFSFDYDLSICAELNNENHLMEWIEINKSNNIEHFYLIDFDNHAQNASVREILDYYSDIVTVIDSPQSEPLWVFYRLHKVLDEKDLLSSSKFFILTTVTPNPYNDSLFLIASGKSEN